MTRRTIAAAVAGSALAALAAGCGSATAVPARIAVSAPYIPLPATPDMAAGYLTVRNTGGTEDRLVKVASPDARSVTMHRSTDATMEPVDALPVPAHGELRFSRGGYHLMIMGLRGKAAVGGTVELDLTFSGSGTVKVKAPIEPIAYRPPGTDTEQGS